MTGWGCDQTDYAINPLWPENSVDQATQYMTFSKTGTFYYSDQLADNCVDGERAQRSCCGPGCGGCLPPFLPCTHRSMGQRPGSSPMPHSLPPSPSCRPAAAGGRQDHQGLPPPPRLPDQPTRPAPRMTKAAASSQPSTSQRLPIGELKPAGQPFPSPPPLCESTILIQIHFFGYPAAY